MRTNHNSTDRKPGEFLLFAVGFLGFLVACGGIILSSAAIAATGAIILLLTLLCFSRDQASRS